jgi:hypothetical protein
MDVSLIQLERMKKQITQKGKWKAMLKTSHNGYVYEIRLNTVDLSIEPSACVRQNGLIEIKDSLFLSDYFELLIDLITKCKKEFEHG